MPDPPKSHSHIPPPPPMLSLDQLEPKKKSSSLTQASIPTEQLNSECLWAAKNPEFQITCIKNKICTLRPPFLIKYTAFDPILQDGPCCGLVAMSILSRDEVSPCELFGCARLSGFTIYGEMFSVNWMVEVLKYFKAFDKYEITVKNGPVFSCDVIGELLYGALLLVPYDSDFNHSPCLKNGNKAHWALITGVLITEDVENFTDKPESVFVSARHGKSLHVATWNLDMLSKSNANLNEFKPKKGKEDLNFTLPKGGIDGPNGLKSKFILLRLR